MFYNRQHVVDVRKSCLSQFETIMLASFAVCNLSTSVGGSFVSLLARQEDPLRGNEPESSMSCSKIMDPNSLFRAAKNVRFP